MSVAFVPVASTRTTSNVSSEYGGKFGNVCGEVSSLHCRTTVPPETIKIDFVASIVAESEGVITAVRRTGADGVFEY